MLRARRLFAGLRRIDPMRVDEVVGAALLVAIELQVWLSPHIHQRVPAALTGVVLSSGVAVRRRWPLGGVLVVLAVATGQRALGGELMNQVPTAEAAAILVFYAMGAFLPARRSLWALGLAVVVVSIDIVTIPGGRISDLPFKVMISVILPWALGSVLREHGRRERTYRETAERLDAGRELHARNAAQGERARIARELHDVIAHSVSVMVIQAGGARMVMDSSPGRAEVSLLTVERAGRDALAEMRRLLEVLDREQVPTALAPQPGLVNIHDLLSIAHKSGLVADLSVDGEPVAVSPALDLCAYRIVQEALTNAIKHAAPGPRRGPRPLERQRAGARDLRRRARTGCRRRNLRRPRDRRHARARRSTAAASWRAPVPTAASPCGPISHS
jgi:signal transduction histidine kinase